ncbi:MAG: sigma-70 family RNA polymerase sigma factor [Planctomycetaceae bacterium]|jgi:RNA polymerase sigma-70 factor, ECF subfamily|nr:sigma-70 family RNA polymerase sigma factor [Planctomycetaceae bacterium]MBT6156365.1 sigma-70 family RNA polymerase sigma factor [Planctomycetaceae bacterium]MBT6483863.1 sigma-70 family RNA polymerase sigma factor [Planctomycetaceae bacterium]MBT6497164.1 sigma-70 family RNA polymerase sigma factor [Planctomycetaceae bacterium]
MNEPQASLAELFRQARAGDERALGKLCEQHRPYLRLLAQRSLDSQIGVRADASDLVQQTMLSAIRNFKTFEGEHSAQFVAWLQIIHERNVVDTIRAHTADKRAVNREGPIVDDRDQFGTQTDSPSARAMRSEDAVQLAQAMETLPEDQREAVRLRHLEGWPIGRIAETLGRSEEASAGLIKRGMAKLRQKFQKL